MPGVLRSFLKRYPDRAAAAAFALLAVVLTYPQVFRLADGARDGGDPLLNAWIMWWEVDAVSSGNILGFFDANIFFPHYRTLAYSEFLIPQTIVGAPLLLLFDNPLIAYNVVLLLSFVVTGLAMYVLAKHLTSDPFAAFVAGVSLAFTPFMFSHLSHIQVIGAAGIPWAFYFLHRYFDEREVRWLLWFSAAYIGQTLANAYYGLYLTYAAGAYIAYRAVRDRRLLEPRFYRHMGIHAALSLLALGPFFSQYYLLKRELGFSRGMAHEGGWYSLFSAPPINRLYGNFTASWHASEAALFPGALVLLLAAWGIWGSRNPKQQGAAAAAPAAAVWGYHAMAALIAMAWALVLLITLTGGVDTTFAGFEISAHDYVNPSAYLAIGIAVRALLRRRHPGIGRGRDWLADPQRFYGCMLFVTVLLTLGQDSPYRILYAYAPGFSGVRALPRIHILTVLCLAVFVAYGTRAVVKQLKRRDLAWVAVLIPALIVVEFASVPVPMFDVRWGPDMPRVYAWLAEQPGDYAVAEYPIRTRLEFDRLFYSTVHRKKLVNGMSGYLSPVYRELETHMRAFPSVATVEDLRALGVRWVIVHRDQYRRPRWRRQVAPGLEQFADSLRLVIEIDDALVFEVLGTTWRTREDFLVVRRQPDSQSTSLPSGDWTVSTNRNPQSVEWAIDGDIGTRWRSDAQSPGDWFAVDFGESVEFSSVVTRLHDHPHDYPRGYRVEVSDDGTVWEVVADDPAVHRPITEYLDPLDMRVEISFSSVEARHLRITQTGEDPIYVWSIHELEVHRRRQRDE